MESRIIDNRKIICDAGCSFSYVSDSRLSTSLHCHPAYELIYIREGKGQEFVGDCVRNFNSGDLVRIGENLPHLYLCDRPQGVDAGNSCDILQFPGNLFPENMNGIDEYAKISRLLGNSARGILFRSESTVRRAVTIMRKFNRQSGINRLLSLIRLLHLLGGSAETVSLSSLKYVSPLKEYMIDDPVSRIYAFLLNNHKEEISIPMIAGHIHFNAASLCRHFKQHTGKTIFQTLSEIRVEYACKLLGSTRLPISQIAWESGFRNQAHFNKQFKQITGQTPKEYRQKMTPEPNPKQ